MNAWDEARLGGRTGQRHALGFWHPMHNLASLAWLPPVSERRKIYGMHRYVLVFNFASLALNQAANNRNALTQDFWWTDVASSWDFSGESTQSVKFSIQLFNTKSGNRFMNDPLFAENFGGPFRQSSSQVVGYAGISGGNNFTMPYFHRRITKIPAGSQLLMRVQNLLQPAAPGQQTVNVQVALGGYIDG